MINQISREEVRSAIEDKLCAQFSISSEEATDEQRAAAFAKAKAANPAQASALQGAFSAGFEEAMMSAMAKAMVEELGKDRQDEAE